jgi:hypothetical protein
MTQRKSALKTKRFWVSLLVLGVVLLYPVKSTVVPEQNVLVVAEDWRPIEGARVRQSWQHYSIEADGHEEDMFTDKNGRVSFPRRTIRANLAWRIVRPVVNILTQGIHASFGVHTNTSELGGGLEGQNSAKVESRPGELVFRRR